MRLFCPIFAALFLTLPSFGAQRDNARMRAAPPTQTARAVAAPQTLAPRQMKPAQQSRSATTPAATTARTASAPKLAQRTTAARAAKAPAIKPAPQKAPRAKTANPQRVVARAATIGLATAETMGDGYVVCRDAYFACMDQFCALRNEQYRRCTCSSRLNQAREREHNFATASNMLKDFEDNNLNVVDKTADEVKAMYSASAGESAMTKDTSDSAKALSGIGDVLASKNTNVAENMGNTADIWGTTSLVGGADLTTLESTALYNAVHAQCSEMVTESCGRVATFNMVVAAYGMYIEQDCAAYMDSLDKQQRQATMATKQMQGQLAVARLENYGAHNSEEINSCLNNVRNDMYGEGACGPDNVKCIDTTGRFVNILTGEPIYTADFWMLEKAITLGEGDPLANSKNAPYVTMLNQKKSTAEDALDKCRDVADSVWDEYLRQTLVDLYQRQFAKVREVQDNCVSAVNECYDEKLEQLKQFAGDLAQENTGSQQIGLTEDLCKQKLETCSMLYGGGPPGLEKLRQYVKNTQTTKLENDCEKYLTNYIQEACTPINDNLHGYPYQCRFYEPGEEMNYRQGDTTADTLYGRLWDKAKDVCTRPDEPITHEVQMIINKIMSDARLKMDGLLAKECENIGGAAWYTGTLGTIPKKYATYDSKTSKFKLTSSAIDDAKYITFTIRIGSNVNWGICTTNDQ